jgi:hypothetical protein
MGILLDNSAEYTKLGELIVNYHVNTKRYQKRCLNIARRWPTSLSDRKGMHERVAAPINGKRSWMTPSGQNEIVIAMNDTETSESFGKERIENLVVLCQI